MLIKNTQAVLPLKSKGTSIDLGRLILACVLGMLPGVLPAQDTNISLTISSDSATALQLEARQAPLAQVLDKINKTTGIPIHYSVLPKGRVTATCVGASLKQILECLLNHKADLIFRTHHNTVPHNAKNNLEEVWVLGTKFDAPAPSVTATECEATVLKQQGQLQAMQAQKRAEANDPDQTETMIKMAQSKDPTEHAQGIGGLLALGKPGDPAIKTVLESALSDSNADVRAQAISSFAHRGEEGTEAALQAAMQDESVDVRIMAVDSVGDNTALLQQALHDKDENVRALAALKLETLNTENTR